MKNGGKVHQLWRAGGERIQRLRTDSEITQLELAEQIYAPSIAWVAQIEAGERPVTSTYYKRFARSLNQSTAQFARGCLAHYDPKAYEALFGDLPANINKVA